MNSAFKQSFLLIVICLLSYTVAPAQKKKNKDALTTEQRMQFDRLFYDAGREKMLNNNDKALELYSQCYKMDEQNAASFYEAAGILNLKKKYNEALPLAQQAVKIDADNEWYQKLLAEVYTNTGDDKNAIKIYEQLVEKYPTHLEHYELLASAYLMSNKPAEALRVYNQLEKQIGIDPELINEKKRIYLKMGDIDKAAAEVNKLIEADPSLENYSMLVELYQANGMQDEAYKTIQKMVVVNPNSAMTCFALAEYYRSKGEKEQSFEQLKKAFGADDATSELKMQVLTSYIPLVSASEELRKQATELAKILTESDPGFAMGHVIYGDFLFQDGQYEKARSEYRTGIEGDNSNYILYSQLLDCNLKLNDMASLEKESSLAIELFPNQPVMFLYNGIAKIQLKKYDEAVKPLLSGSKLVIDNDPLEMNFYTNLGEAYHYTKNYTESDKYFDKALKLEPKNAVTLNNYAYYLSLRNENLEKAEAMSKLSNEISVDNSTYEDTYAWVLYVMKRYEDAKTWIEKAIAHGGDQSGTIVEHYGDILYKLNRPADAVEQWKKARQLGDASEQIDLKITGQKIF